MSELDTAPLPGIGEEQYRIPKIAVPARAILDGGMVVEGSVYVLPVSGRREGRQRVIDLVMEEGVHFLPLATATGVRLIHTTRIVQIWVEDPEDAGLGQKEAEEALDQGFEALEIPVELELAGMPEAMSRISGRLRLIMPPGQQRVIDYLNQDSEFFGLQTDQGATLVSKRYVLDLWQVQR